MPLRLTVKEAARLSGLQKAKPSAKKAAIPAVPTEQQQPGQPTGPVTHRLVKSLASRFGSSAPVLDSLANCAFDGRRWQCAVYVECGETLFELADSDFRQFFTEV
jgi:hypothetical protein